MDQPKKNAFLLKTEEKAEHNQYWYSGPTIKALVDEIEASATKVAFLSTPSVYFSLKKGSEVRDASWVLDFDDQWKKDPHYFKYDFNKPEEIPAELRGTFDCVVIDPPFITKEVWEKYTEAAKMLLQEGGKAICSTVRENAPFMKDLLGVEPCAFKPSVPNLVYQYNFFVNFEPKVLGEKNPEIPEDED